MGVISEETGGLDIEISFGEVVTLNNNVDDDDDDDDPRVNTPVM